MQHNCKKCNKVFMTSMAPSTIDRMAIASGLCSACMRDELLQDNNAGSNSQQSVSWTVIQLRQRLNQFRNDLLKIIPLENNGSDTNFIIQSSLNETTLSLSAIQDDDLATFLEWVREGRVLHGLFMDGDWKSKILCAPVSEISILRSYIKEHEELRIQANRSRQNVVSNVVLARTQRSYSSSDSYDSYEEYDYEPDYDEEKYARELEHDSQWDTEQRTLDDALDEWERNRGHGLSTYDDSDDYY